MSDLIISKILLDYTKTPLTQYKPTFKYNKTSFEESYRNKRYSILDTTRTLVIYYPYLPFYRATKKGTDITIGSDIFTNGSIILSILSLVYQNIAKKKYGLDGYVMSYLSSYHLKYAYRITSDLRYSVSQFISENPVKTLLNKGSDVFSGKMLSSVFLSSILIQMFSNLSYLKESLDFRGNRVSVENVYISDAKVDIRYAGIKHKSDFLVVAYNFDYSEVKYPYGDQTYYVYQEDEYNQQLVFERGAYTRLLTWDMYRIDQRPHNYIPKDWDAITFIVSFMMIPEVYYAVTTNPELYRVLIQSTFPGKHKDIIMSKIYNIVSKGMTPSYDRALNILKGMSFKEGMIDRVLSYFAS